VIFRPAGIFIFCIAFAGGIELRGEEVEDPVDLPTGFAGCATVWGDFLTTFLMVFFSTEAGFAFSFLLTLTGVEEPFPFELLVLVTGRDEDFFFVGLFFPAIDIPMLLL